MKIHLIKNIFCILGLSFVHHKFLAQTIEKPKLVVGIVVDQMCYEYLYRYQSKFSDKGFNKLMQKGTHCRNTQYNYVPTYTGPGHASIYTGTTPNNHGIVGNDWYNRTTNKKINCVEDSSVTSVGTDSKYGSFSPRNLVAFTITDQLKLTYPKSKVISVSIKNRSAILPGGHLSDGSYWYDYKTGNFITSTFYKTVLPKWVDDFNSKKEVDSYMKQTWNTLLGIEKYTESGPDDSPYEHILKGKSSPTFPYDLKEMTGDKPDYDLFTETPFCNTFLTDFAIESLKNEQLGKGSESDFLCVSYSSTDIAGHTFGPYSIEIQDMYMRLDLDIARLISYLEKEIGKDNFILFLTADHAVVPVPQYLVDKKLPGGYVYRKPLFEELKNKLLSKYGVDFINSTTNNNVYFERSLLKDKNIDIIEAQQFVKNEIKQWSGVKAVYTADELENGLSNSEWKKMIQLGYRYHESGDVVFILEPGYLPMSTNTENSHKGTSHGSAYNYDTHVPLIWYGGKIPKREVIRRVEITDIAATLVPILNLQKPSAMTGEPILELFSK
jgi:predicted AlkP superfamily pyrophosphatase or phosphodiesterase